LEGTGNGAKRTIHFGHQVSRYDPQQYYTVRQSERDYSLEFSFVCTCFVFLSACIDILC